MAALRSALAMLSRGSSGSSAAAYMGGREMGINQVFHRAAPPLHPAATRNVEGCRHFSTELGAADKAGSGRRMWWRRVRDRAKNASLEEKDRALFVWAVFVLGTPAVIVVKSTRDMLRYKKKTRDMLSDKW